MRELTSTDAKILGDLLIDGRKSFTQIGEECGETKVTICKRFKEMEKSGVIVGSTIQLDYASLCYNTVGNITFRALPENIDNILSNIQRIPNIYGVLKLNKNTVDVIATLRDTDELNRLKEIIKRQPSVTDVVTNIWMGIRNMPHNLSVAASNDQYPKRQMNKTKSIEIDVVDRQIIELLAKDGRAPFANIAKEIGTATNTVIRKYQRLQQNGIIRITIQINPAMIGYQGAAVFNLAFQTPDPSLVVDKLSTIPDVTLMIKTSGRYDLSVFSLVKNVRQIIDLKDTIFEVANISKWEMFVDKIRCSLPSYKEYISTF